MVFGDRLASDQTTDQPKSAEKNRSKDISQKVRPQRESPMPRFKAEQNKKQDLSVKQRGSDLYNDGNPSVKDQL